MIRLRMSEITADTTICGAPKVNSFSGIYKQAKNNIFIIFEICSTYSLKKNLYCDIKVQYKFSCEA